ncbi:D-alanyl-D-alanine carboxypeptidase [Lederbergia sp. NSJ-179]|uniref:D-alanyl-D-alanine carboxypeptidase family protein n=1 Tax=Lederbergia sp. NSJ-179 TaxID=2931402 RepID=UPI001FD35284|nr:D-alanyl-D-alanine carboxypeptidase family protein [Lederbergia sp. NSJ-179]MCJ7843135.1 D-alanyl-D-alanine carboxypeptidase [Lederbergia sp. NSJ-179]
MKRFIVLISLVIVMSGGVYFFKQDAFATEKVYTSLSFMERGGLEKTVPKGITLPELGIQAKSVILLDAGTGHVLYEKNKELALPPASMSKIMTELLVLEAIENQGISWDQAVTPSKYVFTIASIPGLASVSLQQDQTYTVRELFEAMAIHSANDAAIALAETVAGSEKEFVEQMNNRAEQLGLDQTHFVNSSGLNNQDLGAYFSTGGPNDANLMSAQDLARLAQRLLIKYPEILQISAEPTLVFGSQTYKNTNLMLPGIGSSLESSGVDGLKTGFTDEAGYCFIGTVERGDTRLISVVMGTDSMIARFTETEKLYDAAFSLIDT